MDDDKSLMDKTTDELTVKDQLKLSAGITAACVAVPFAIGGVCLAVDKGREKFREWKKNRSTPPEETE